jgi:hypothetical protein
MQGKILAASYTPHLVIKVKTVRSHCTKKVLSLFSCTMFLSDHFGWLACILM